MVNVPEAAGRGAGGFLGGLFNNPGVVILGGLAIALAFFSGDIRRAFGSLGESISGGLVNIELPDIQLPTINFPEITLPSIGDIFGGGPSEPESAPLTPPGAGEFNPADQPVLPTDIDIALSEGATPSDIAQMIGFPDIDPNLFQPPGQDVPQTPVPEGPSVITPAGVDIGPFLGLEPVTPAVPIPLPPPISPITGGGPSFEGGTIFETPIENLSLSQIIDQFMVTASQAADIQAQAIGFTPEEEAFLGQQGTIGGVSIMEPTGPAVSDPSVSGLTPEEIFAALFGNVQNPDF